VNAERPALNAAEALARIDRSDAELRAWAYVDRAAVRAVAAEGPLAGMPFGVKDIIDVCGMPTRYGLPDFSVPSAPIDAWCVATLRAAGAVPLGKTHSTALAFRDPAPTRNPHHAERTPGGSSAGSAAAVGAGQVPFALATQTLGSIARPAAFCGVVGYKPTHGTIPAQGVTPQAPTLDTIGIIAADTSIAARVAAVYLPDLECEPRAAPRVAYAPGTFAGRFEPAVLAALQTASERIAAAGADVMRIDLPAIVEEAIAPHWAIDMFEANAVLRPLRAYDLPPLVAAFLTEAGETTYDAYRAALAFRARTRPEIAALLARYDVMLVACANPAPGRESTGDVVPFMPWTFWGVPVLTLPVARSPEGLPIGIQLIAAPNADATLLRAARWIERALRGVAGGDVG
jgi:Asp-tRNA(Asn)/Glu-tRNA(Gln) amidotransferase A subunit family amidase